LIPLLTSDEMRAADADAAARRGVNALVRDAGTAVALEASAMLGSCYGALVAVVVGPGLNGADGRVAAAWLRARGAKVDVIEVADQPVALEGYELVIDAAFGLGCSRPYVAPTVSEATLVLAVDLPSGVNADTGELFGEPVVADVTLAIGALKPAHVIGPAALFVGALHFAGLGIVGEFENGVLEDGDLAGFIQQSSSDHKWTHAMQAFAGSTLMPGAASLVVRGALAGGASMVRLTSRGDVANLVELPPEIVHSGGDDIEPRCRALVAGPGLGEGTAKWLRECLIGVDVPVVLDADGLDASLLPGPLPSERQWVLTPHDGEFARLTGAPVPNNRIDAVKQLSRETGCVVLLKGPTTIIANPTGQVRVVLAGTPTLATAGSGDVLSGLIGATIARGHEPFEAAALAAHLHGRAGSTLPIYATASQIPGAVTAFLETL
jgi:ADP-dependent NAD(P)H-hydrate dehydratase / NAD(P)H-hydrate epimerase